MSSMLEKSNGFSKVTVNKYADIEGLIGRGLTAREVDYLNCAVSRYEFNDGNMFNQIIDFLDRFSGYEDYHSTVKTDDFKDKLIEFMVGNVVNCIEVHMINIAHSSIHVKYNTLDFIDVMLPGKIKSRSELVCYVNNYSYQSLFIRSLLHASAKVLGCSEPKMFRAKVSGGMYSSDMKIEFKDKQYSCGMSSHLSGNKISKTAALYEMRVTRTFINGENLNNDHYNIVAKVGNDIALLVPAGSNAWDKQREALEITERINTNYQILNLTENLLSQVLEVGYEVFERVPANYDFIRVD